MSQAFRHELNLVLALDRVHEHLIGLSSERNESSTGAHLNTQDLVGVVNLSNWSALVAVPEVDGCSLSARYQLKLVVAALAHAIEGAVHGLMTDDPFLLLQVVGHNRSIR